MDLKHILVSVAIVSSTVIVTAIIGVIMVLDKTSKGAIVSNDGRCAEIGKLIFEKGGTAGDATISVLFCEGVTFPSAMGLGGGFLMTLYKKESNEIVCLDARETAPGKAHENMYGGDPKLSQIGALAVAVPGELIGYWHLYNRFGKGLPWADLIQPSIDLCEKGFAVSPHLAKALQDAKIKNLNDSVIKEVMINPHTGTLYKEGEIMKREKLGKTLQIIAEKGGMVLHNGELTEGFVKDIQRNGGIITVEDMRNYKPLWKEPVKTTLSSGHTLYSFPLPGSGPVLAMILNILDSFLLKGRLHTAINSHRMVESFKFSYGARTRLGDTDSPVMNNLVNKMLSKEHAKELREKIDDKQTFDNSSYGTLDVEEGHGTAHISVLAPNGDAVAVTSTVNGKWSAYFGSESTGILLNNEMDDFANLGFPNLYGIPPSPANFIKAGKRPMSSMCPTIILSGSKAVMIIGAAGGSKITSSVAQVIIKNLWYGIEINKAMDDGRFYHQLFPNKLELEHQFVQEHLGLVESLRGKGHHIEYLPAERGFCAVNVISQADGHRIRGVYDKRRGGGVSYL